MTTKMRNAIGKPKIHLLLWGLFITWEVVFVGLFFGEFGHPITYSAHYSLIIALFYAHVLFLLPWALNKNQQALWRIPLTLLVETGGFIILSFLTDYLLIKYGYMKVQSQLILNLPYVLKTLYREFYFLGFSTGLYYLTTYLQEKKKTGELERRHLIDIIEKQRAEEEIVKAQNAFLISQINPHFFFNTLDYLYHNVLETSPQSAEAISILATMMRFAIDADKVGEYIRLGDEIEQVENLIYLNQLREHLAIRLEIEDRVRDIWLIPLVILTLTENIFKHGYLKDPNLEAVIRISMDEENLVIETVNHMYHKNEIIKTGDGLNNIEKRLKNSYGKGVFINNGSSKKNNFQVSIILPLSVLTPSESFLYPSADIDRV
jgi:two-component system LytT family sensor kinase